MKARCATLSIFLLSTAGCSGDDPAGQRTARLADQNQDGVYTSAGCADPSSQDCVVAGAPGQLDCDALDWSQDAAGVVCIQCLDAAGNAIGDPSCDPGEPPPCLNVAGQDPNAVCWQCGPNVQECVPQACTSDADCSPGAICVLDSNGTAGGQPSDANTPGSAGGDPSGGNTGDSNVPCDPSVAGCGTGAGTCQPPPPPPDPCASLSQDQCTASGVACVWVSTSGGQPGTPPVPCNDPTCAASGYCTSDSAGGGTGTCDPSAGAQCDPNASGQP